MKRKALISIVFILSVIFIYAQSPQTFKYQAVLRDADGLVRQNESVVIKVSIRQGSGSGTEVFSETHNTQTNEFGLVNLNIGTINPSGFAAIDWSDGPYYVKIFVDGTEMGTSQLLSIPYALHSINADKIAGNPVSGTPNTDQILKWDGTQWIPQDDGLTLPYYADYIGGGTAFEIYQPNGTANLMYLTTDGDGKVGRFSSNSSSADVAVSIESWSNIKAALEVDNSGSGGAADFWGDVEMWDNLNINGTISKSSGTFKIDHPLDPENKYLYHSFVESPDMMNVYNGNIILNSQGEAIVELPEWFEALNMEFRYQLTCIGGFAQVYISKEISNNRFKISGGSPNLKVSWQVTGIRQDPYANENRIQVEIDKPANELGYYLHHKEYDKPYEKSIQFIKEQRSASKEK